MGLERYILYSWKVLFIFSHTDTISPNLLIGGVSPPVIFPSSPGGWNPMIHRNGKSFMQIFPFLLLIALLSGCISDQNGGTTAPVSAGAIAAGDVENGRALFMGYVHLENEGPPCLGCHSVGSNGLLGGGSMGPNLTDVASQRSNTALASILSNFGPELSPVMQPIYTAHPLTVSEQADLIAFMIASEGQPETDKELIVVGISLAGTLAAAGALGFLYRGRMRGARRPLVNKAQKELQ